MTTTARRLLVFVGRLLRGLYVAAVAAIGLLGLMIEAPPEIGRAVLYISGALLAALLIAGWRALDRSLGRRA